LKVGKKSKITIPNFSQPNDNFNVTGKGIGFNYTLYETGPYTMEEVNLFFPFAELNAYLQPGFRKLILA
jgi:hypothetical protein